MGGANGLTALLLGRVVYGLGIGFTMCVFQKPYAPFGAPRAQILRAIHTSPMTQRAHSHSGSSMSTTPPLYLNPLRGRRGGGGESTQARGAHLHR